MDILIKSFNRPYYLDRCIQSIYKNVVDSEISITVLDDGTPSKYLKKLQDKFPEIKIVTSDAYDEKSLNIEQNLSLDNKKIPIKMWIEAAKNASDYFVLLEDDIWFTKDVNLEETKVVLKEKNVALVKLFWLKNPKLIHAKTIETLKNITIYDPIVFTKNPVLHRIIFGMKRYTIPNLMAFLNLYSEEKALQYYSIYGVAGAIFHKEYFLSLWQNHYNEVDENVQLKNAVQFWHKNPNIAFARAEEEVAATGFSSSATNKKYDTGDFDIFTFNKILNEAWLGDQLNSMKDFSNDLNSSEIATILAKANDPKARVEDWEKWVNCFKRQFQEIGCNI
ncbi:glycosyltransferase family 2 protein [Flavobacterium antarcticum]|uniref:glycosyltransferase family 2 protein n=1 Tax=Flavobacterium antarcticum TaxID=271155 RepID=UPI0003B36AAC|nr:hypothetical protein [Flavobacterium antarcticum]